jgi:hypothetical protein
VLGDSNDMILVTLKVPVYSLLYNQKFISYYLGLRNTHFAKIHHAIGTQYFFYFHPFNFSIPKPIMQCLIAKTPLKTPFNGQNNPKLAKTRKKQYTHYR